MSLNSCVPVCVNVLANPVTNSVYYKAAMSRLPRQGCLPTGVGCKAQNSSLNSATPPVSGTDSKFHLSAPCPRVSACLLLVPVLPCARLFSFSSLSLPSLGQFIYSSEGGAVLILSQATEPIRTALGHSRGQNS